MSTRRFVLLGGPGGFLTCRPAGCPSRRDRYRGWVVLASIHRPLSESLARTAKLWAVRMYHC